MNKKKLVFYLIFLFLFILSFSLGNDFIGTISAKDSSLYKELELFTDVVTIIKKTYVEDVLPKKMIYGALSGMLNSLDSYSQFLDQDMYKEIKIETKGKFGGIGAEVTIENNYLIVVSPLEGTPAFKAGISPGDRIISINDVSTKKITLAKAVKLLRGKVGSKVKLTIARAEANKLLEFEIQRDIVKVQSIEQVKVIDEGIGYIKIVQFQEETARDFKKALKQLQDKNIKGLILDLRNNPGGLLEEAVKATSFLIEEGKLIVSTKGRLAEQNLELKSKNKGDYFRKPLAVLINKGSASGSEVMAGAIKDLKRGILIGTSSFGKGSVQSIVPLSDGSAVRITTAKYYTPCGKSIIDEGIHPDIVVKNRNKEDLQLLRAVDVLKGISLYIEQKKSLKVREKKEVSKRES